MENLEQTTKMMNEIAEAASNLFVDLISAKNLVDEGKEVMCSRKLQGTLQKYGVLEQLLLDYFVKAGIKTDDDNVVEENS